LGLSVSGERRQSPNINEGLAYQCFHVRGEVLIALLVKFNARELAELQTIGEDLRSHCPLRFGEREAPHRALKALLIKLLGHGFSFTSQKLH
jgi:hypothetical protein